MQDHDPRSRRLRLVLRQQQEDIGLLCGRRSREEKELSFQLRKSFEPLTAAAS